AVRYAPCFGRNRKRLEQCSRPSSQSLLVDATRVLVRDGANVVPQQASHGHRSGRETLDVVAPNAVFREAHANSAAARELLDEVEPASGDGLVGAAAGYAHRARDIGV